MQVIFCKSKSSHKSFVASPNSSLKSFVASPSQVTSLLAIGQVKSSPKSVGHSSSPSQVASHFDSGQVKSQVITGQVKSQVAVLSLPHNVWLACIHLYMELNYMHSKY